MNKITLSIILLAVFSGIFVLVANVKTSTSQTNTSSPTMTQTKPRMVTPDKATAVPSYTQPNATRKTRTS